MPTLLKDWLENSTEYEAAGRKLAIVAGPGGNAGVNTAGILSAVAETTTFPTSFHYIGISVGAFGWLYALISREHHAGTLFGRCYCDNRFFNPWRLLTSRPSLGLDYVLNQVTQHVLPINYPNARTSPYMVSALTTDTDGQPHLLPLTGVSETEVRQALRATSSMPLIGRTDNLAHAAGWDGWVTEDKLLLHLQQAGITDVIWILNTSLTEPENFVSRMLWQKIVRKFHRHNPHLAERIQSRLSAGNFLATPPSGMNLEVIQPASKIPPTTRNPANLFYALGTSYRRMSEYLGHPNLPYPAEWAEWQHHMPK